MKLFFNKLLIFFILFFEFSVIEAVNTPRSIKYDDMGNPIEFICGEDLCNSYQYDCQNHLVKFTDVKG